MSNALVNPNDTAQRMPVSQQGNIPVMIDLQGHGAVPPSPDKARGMPLMGNPPLPGPQRRTPLSEGGQPTSGLQMEDTPGTHSVQDRGPLEIGLQSGNGNQQMIANQGASTHLLKSVPGASPQQQSQQVAPMTSSHNIHFPNAPSSSQSSRPKTPNRASPRPYHHPLTPTNRPPSTEPSEINLSPERLNASIAGLFPPKINIPLPPRQPNLNRGFDQQGLNPTTLKAIGQAPPNLATLPVNSNSSGNNIGPQSYPSGVGIVSSGGKQDKQPGVGQAKRASPGNSRRSSPASNRKAATPSPGRQKGAKTTLTSPPHQQQMLGLQTVMVSTASALPTTSVSLPSAESQKNFRPLQSITGSGDPVKDGQTVAPRPEQHQATQLREQASVSKLSSPQLPSQDPKSQDPNSSVEQHVDDRNQPRTTAQQELGTAISPGFRDAPTSLNQLLDNTGTQSSLVKSPNTEIPKIGRDSVQKESPQASLAQESQSNPVVLQSTDSGPTSDTDQKPKLVSVSSPNLVTSSGSNLQPVSAVSSVGSNQAVLLSLTSIPNTTVSSNANLMAMSNASQSVLQRPMSSAPTPQNQITVFVTSNPISSATNTASVVPPAIVSKVLAVPNKTPIRSPDVRQQNPTNTRQQFITGPVYSIIQATSSSNVMSQPVTMVGPLVSANIQLAPNPVSTTTPLSSTATATNSPAVSIAASQQCRPVIGQLQVQALSSQACPLGKVSPTRQSSPGVPKQETVFSANGSKSTSVGQSSLQPSTAAPFQQLLASPPACSSPGTTAVARRIPLSPTTMMLTRGSPVQTVVDRNTVPIICSSNDDGQKELSPVSQLGKSVEVPTSPASEMVSSLKPSVPITLPNVQVTCQLSPLPPKVPTPELLTAPVPNTSTTTSIMPPPTSTSVMLHLSSHVTHSSPPSSLPGSAPGTPTTASSSSMETSHQLTGEQQTSSLMETSGTDLVKTSEAVVAPNLSGNFILMVQTYIHRDKKCKILITFFCEHKSYSSC